jgi:segregation and condensation protein B
MEERVITEARRAVEAVVMAAIEPVEPQVLAQLVEMPVTEIETLCAELAEEYERDGRGFSLVRVAGGYRFQTHPDMAPYVERFVLEGQTVRLSAPALETLAIVAYKQPVSRAQLAAIRGVSVESTLSTLEQRGYVEEVGHDPGPGQAILYGTTQLFLERLGLDSLLELPPLAEFVPEPSVVEALERGLLLRTEAEPEAPTDLDDVEATDEPAAPSATRRTFAEITSEVAEMAVADMEVADMEVADIEPIEVKVDDTEVDDADPFSGEVVEVEIVAVDVDIVAAEIAELEFDDESVPGGAGESTDHVMVDLTEPED